MKKIFILLVSSLLLLNLCACQNNTNLDNIDGSQQTENKNEASSGAITIDDVKKAKVTDSSKFEYENVDGGISITDYNGDDEIVVIPEKIDGLDVVEIGENAFANNDEIKGIKIADNISVIGKNAFVNCYNLEVVICGENLKVIEEFAFDNCESLYIVELNDKLETLKESCFAGTDTLEKIYISNNVVNIEYPFLETDTNVTIITEAGSAAEQYAKDSGIKYEIR